MKKWIIAILLGLGIAQVNAQKMNENEVPVAVTAAFKKAYPLAKDTKWNKEEAGYEASFDLHKKDISVVYDNMGMVKEVETEIEQRELPQAIQQTLANEYKGYKIEEVAKILTGNITTYETEVEKDEASLALVFDTAGKLIKKVIEEEKD